MADKFNRSCLIGPLRVIVFVICILTMLGAFNLLWSYATLGNALGELYIPMVTSQPVDCIVDICTVITALLGAYGAYSGRPGPLKLVSLCSCCSISHLPPENDNSKANKPSPPPQLHVCNVLIVCLLCRSHYDLLILETRDQSAHHRLEETNRRVRATNASLRERIPVRRETRRGDQQGNQGLGSCSGENVMLWLGRPRGLASLGQQFWTPEIMLHQLVWPLVARRLCTRRSDHLRRRLQRTR